MSIEDVLDAREKTHGDFREVAKISQTIKAFYARKSMPLHQREALDMIASKLARIVSGDNNEMDHWIDLSGYATLVVSKRLPQSALQPASPPQPQEQLEALEERLSDVSANVSHLRGSQFVR